MNIEKELTSICNRLSTIETLQENIQDQLNELLIYLYNKDERSKVNFFIDPWESIIKEWVLTQEEKQKHNLSRGASLIFTPMDILTSCLEDVDCRNIGVSTSLIRISRILQKLGWEKSSTTNQINGVTCNLYVKPRRKTITQEELENEQ